MFIIDWLTGKNNKAAKGKGSNKKGKKDDEKKIDLSALNLLAKVEIHYGQKMG